MNKDKFNNNLEDNKASNNRDEWNEVDARNATPDRGEDEKEQQKSKKNNVVAILVGRWAMPTTVLLVLITCMSGYYLSESAFTPVVGMIAPVVMALIMVIKEASVGKDEDPMLVDRMQERKERLGHRDHKVHKGPGAAATVFVAANWFNFNRVPPVRANWLKSQPCPMSTKWLPCWGVDAVTMLLQAEACHQPMENGLW